MAILVIAEKPSVGQEIARVLGARTKRTGYLEGKGYIVTWAIGHLAQLCDPETYTPDWKRWKAETLPMLPQTFKIEPAGDAHARSQLQVILTLLKQPGIERVVNACDAGREGELIFQYILELAGPVAQRLMVQRLWVSSMTDEAIKAGFARLRSAREVAGLAEAARMRAQADWIVGLNATRAYTIAHRPEGGSGSRPMLLTLGRVQTPTLALLVKREIELAEFKPTPYWLVEAGFGDSRSGQILYSGRWFREEQVRLLSADEAEQIVARVQGKQGKITSIDERIDSEPAPLLYDLTALQRDANRRYRYTAARTLQIAQALYEEKKLITYPRTSSRYLSKDIIPSLPDRLRHLAGERSYAPFAGHLLSLDRLPISGRIVNDRKVTDHHAIIPTERDPKLLSLSAEERNIYDLIARRFLAIFYPPAKTRRTVVITVVERETFRSRGAILLEQGWKAVYGEERSQAEQRAEEDEPEGSLPPLKVGESYTVAKAEALRRETQPPKRYSEGMLLSAMETAGKLVEDEELKQALKESGLGTPATRAAIIERLIKTGYAVRQGNALAATPKGIELVKLINEPTLVTPELTGQWERKLSLIEHGEYAAGAFMQEVAGYTTEIVRAALSSQGQANFAALPSADAIGKCPLCGSELRQIGKGYLCSNYGKAEGKCSFAIWQILGKLLTPRQVQLLLSKKYLPEVKGFLSPRTNKRFSAGLRLESDGRITFDFERQPTRSTSRHSSTSQTAQATNSETAGSRPRRSDSQSRATESTESKRPNRKRATAETQAAEDVAHNSLAVVEPVRPAVNGAERPAMRCPRCGGTIIEGKKGFGCANWRAEPACNFVIWKERNGISLNEEHVRQLLADGRTEVIKGFTSRAGKPFDAALILNADGTVTYDFTSSPRRSGWRKTKGNAGD